MRAVDRVGAAAEGFEGPLQDWTVGQPAVRTPQVLRRALAVAARADHGRYPPAAGRHALREIIAERERRRGAAVTADDVVVTHGAKAGLLALLSTLVGPGDEVIHPTPCYPAYPHQVRRLGGLPVGVAERGFAGWAGAVGERLSPRTRAVVLSSPSNPTGAVLPRGELDALLETCAARDVRVIVDEAYDGFVFDVIDPTTVDHPALVRVGSASKTFAACGWRVGWVIAGAALAARVVDAQAALLNPPNAIAQTALEALLEVDPGELERARTTMRRRLGDLRAALAAAGLETPAPAGGFYLWTRLPRRDHGRGAVDDVAWCEDLARRRGVLAWPGADFHGPGHVRWAPAAASAREWPRVCSELARRLRGA